MVDGVARSILLWTEKLKAASTRLVDVSARSESAELGKNLDTLRSSANSPGQSSIEAAVVLTDRQRRQAASAKPTTPALLASLVAGRVLLEFLELFNRVNVDRSHAVDAALEVADNGFNKLPVGLA